MKKEIRKINDRKSHVSWCRGKRMLVKWKEEEDNNSAFVFWSFSWVGRLFLLKSIGIWVRMKYRSHLIDWEVSCITHLSDSNGGEKVHLSWLINPSLSYCMHSISFQEIPLAVLAATIPSLMLQWGTWRFLVQSTLCYTEVPMLEIKAYFKMWILIYTTIILQNIHT